MRQHLAHVDAEFLLRAQLPPQALPVLAGAALQPGPPLVQDLALRLGQREADAGSRGRTARALRRVLPRPSPGSAAGGRGRRARWRGWTATPAMRLAPSASTRTCSSASKTAPASRRAGSAADAAWHCGDAAGARRRPPRRGPGRRPGRPDRARHRQPHRGSSCSGGRPSWRRRRGIGGPLPALPGPSRPARPRNATVRVGRCAIARVVAATAR